jgi:RNA polymerase sigma-70 factor (ECF subfamily)
VREPPDQDHDPRDGDAGAERTLVDALRRGDRAAFDLAYGRYKARIYRFLLALARRRDAADDLFQETFLKLARFAPALREDTDLEAWLFTVARNAYRSHRRWAMLDVSRFVTLGDESAHADDRGDSADDAADRARALRRVERALERVSTASREALLLVGVEGFDQQRAAAVLGVSYAAFRQRLARARAELVREMEREERRGQRRDDQQVSHAVRRT